MVGTDLALVVVKNDLDIETLSLELFISDQSRSDVSDADQSHIPAAIDSQNVTDLPLELRHGITQAARPERTEKREVLANLRRSKLFALRQLFGGDCLMVLFFENGQNPIIQRQPMYRRFRNFLFIVI